MSSNLRLSPNVPSEQRQTSFCPRTRPPFHKGGNIAFTWGKFGECGEGVTEGTEFSLAEPKELGVPRNSKKLSGMRAHV